MRNKICGGIGNVWGGALLARWLMADAPVAGSAADQSGQSGAVLFGAASVGGWAVLLFQEVSLTIYPPQAASA